MKKLLFISGAVVVNIVLVLTAVTVFNPSNLNLSELEFFNGFDITNLFPSDGIGNAKLIGSIIGLVFINALLVKALKRKGISLN
jgi:hypothetical protein